MKDWDRGRGMIGMDGGRGMGVHDTRAKRLFGAP